MAAAKEAEQAPPDDAQLRREVQAMVAAHQELGERFGAELADSLVERLHAAIDLRVEEKLRKRKSGASPLVLPVVSLIIGLPAMAIAGVVAGPLVSPAIFLTPWIAIIAINLIYAFSKRS